MRLYAFAREHLTQLAAGLARSINNLLTWQYCHKAKKIIQDATDEYEYIDLDVRDDGCRFFIHFSFCSARESSKSTVALRR